MKLQLRVRTKLLLVACAAVFTAVVLVSWNVVVRTESMMRATTLQETAQSARLLAASLEGPVARGDRAEIVRCVRLHLDHQGAVYAAVFGPDDRDLLVAQGIVSAGHDRPGAGSGEGSGETLRGAPPAASEAEIDAAATAPLPDESGTIGFRAPIQPAEPGAEPLGSVLVLRSTAAVDAAIKSMERAVIRMDLILLVVTIVLLTVAVSRTVSRPIRRLRLATRDVAHGELGAVIPVTGADELSELAADFNEVTESLRQSREEIARQNKEIQRKNVELFNTSQYLDSILTSSTDYAIIAEDLDGRILSVNEGARRTFGYAPDELEGQHLQQLLSDSDRGIKTIRELYRRVLGGERDVSCEINGRHKDGRTFPASFSFSLRSYASGEPAGFVIIARDLTRDKEEQELILRNRELERASRLKSEFLANMSHELRTPLNSVIGFSEVLTDGFFGSLNEQQLEYITDIHNSGRHLLDLINDILDISKIEAGRMELQRDYFDIEEAIERVAAMVTSQAQKKSIGLSTKIAENVPQLYADSGRFKQIILNLVSNAIKFTPEKGQVEIEVAHGDGAVRISVSDDGIGIPPQYLPTIFDKFQQVEGGYRRSYGGTGLGLAIVKEFVELHGGRVWVESEVGKGSRFTLSFPDSLHSMRAAVNADLEARGEPDPAEEALGEGDIADGAGERSSATDVPSLPSQPEATVLVVDDDPFALKRFFRFLSPRYRVETAMTGAQALERAQEDPPDVITLKIFLPDLDGWEVLRCLKENPKTSRIPIVIVSVPGDSSDSDKGKGFLLGASDYFVKPIHRNELLASLNAFSLRVPGRDTPPRVLVIDDNPKDIRLFESYLKPAGFELDTARGGREGIARIRACDPDVVILDLLMPECSGFEVVEEIRKEKGSKMPVLVLTNGYLSVDEKITLMEEIYSMSSKGRLDKETLQEEVSRVVRSARAGEVPFPAQRKDGASG